VRENHFGLLILFAGLAAVHAARKITLPTHHRIRPYFDRNIEINFDSFDVQHLEKD
jgi:hypothetical protein